MDAGLAACARIGSLVWYDVDKDDIWDSYENGINGLKVELGETSTTIGLCLTIHILVISPTLLQMMVTSVLCTSGNLLHKIIMPPLGLVQARQTSLENCHSMLPTNKRTIPIWPIRLDHLLRDHLPYHPDRSWKHLAGFIQWLLPAIWFGKTATSMAGRKQENPGSQCTGWKPLMPTTSKLRSCDQ